MSSAPHDPVSAARIRPMQIIALALPVGALFALGTLYYIAQGQPQPAQQLAPNIAGVPILSAVASLLTLLNLGTSFVLPPILTKSRLAQLGKVDQITPGLQQTLLGCFQTGLVLRLALLEGSALLAGVAYLLERTLGVLFLGVGCVIIMLLFFPTLGRVTRWLSAQYEHLLGKRTLDG